MRDQPSPDPAPALRAAQHRLSEATDRLVGHVIALDESRQTCSRLAEHYDDFARRMAVQYPSLAGPASQLAELHRELDVALSRLSASTESVAAVSGRVADRVAMAGRHGAA